MTAVALPTTPAVSVDSLVLGLLQVPDECIFTFPEGINGFETHHQFALVPAAREGLFWLQSLVSRDVMFLMIDPFVAVPGFEVDLGLTERVALELDNPMDVLVLAIVTLPLGNLMASTANLRGPVVLNASKRLASQVISAMPGHETRTPVDLHALPVRSNP